jgi:hypothetical protein
MITVACTRTELSLMTDPAVAPYFHQSLCPRFRIKPFLFRFVQMIGDGELIFHTCGFDEIASIDSGYFQETVTLNSWISIHSPLDSRLQSRLLLNDF